MRKINDLIKELCPNGVEYKMIKVTFDLFSGMTGVSNIWANAGNCQFIDYMYAYNNNILFVDATEECVRYTNKNKLSDENIDNIINLLKDRKSVENKSYLASYDEVIDNEYNISVISYLKTNTDDNNIDIEEVNKMLAEVVPRQQQIRKELEEIIKELEVDYHE